MLAVKTTETDPSSLQCSKLLRADSTEVMTKDEIVALFNERFPLGDSTLRVTLSEQIA